MYLETSGTDHGLKRCVTIDPLSVGYANKGLTWSVATVSVTT